MTQQNVVSSSSGAGGFSLVMISMRCESKLLLRVSDDGKRRNGVAQLECGDVRGQNSGHRDTR
jgi:hypothetical protein